jgi:2'-5' RNA ligase
MRLFVAVEFSDQVRSALAKVQASLAPECDGVRWIPSHQLHLTVKFLGDVPDRDVNRVAEAVARAAAKSVPCDLEIAGCGCFPPRGQVRIVWAGGSEKTGALTRCVEAVEGELEALGFPKERRRFSAHVTIGRVREDRSGGRIRSTVEAHTFPSLEQEVSSITLMSSVLSPKGPTYTPVSRTRLGPTEGKTP